MLHLHIRRRFYSAALSVLAVSGCSSGSHMQPALPQSLAPDSPAAYGPVADDRELSAALETNSGSANPFALKQLPASVVLSLATVGGSVWLTDVSTPGSGTSYLGRVNSPTDVDLYPLDAVPLHGKNVSVLPLFILPDPATHGSNQRILFDWAQFDASAAELENGLALAQPAQPSQPDLIPAAKPGDPLYSPNAANAFNSPLAYTPRNGKVWGFIEPGPLDQATGAWNLSYPLKPQADYGVAQLAGVSSLTPIGAGDRLWFMSTKNSQGSLTSLSASNQPSFGPPLPVVPVNEVRYGTDGNFWVSSFSSLSKVSSQGALVASYAAPRLSYDPLFFATSDCSSWLFSFDANSFYIMRVRHDGAWSWYATARGSYSSKRYGVSAMLTAGSTVYTALGYPGGGAPPLLLSFNMSRLISAWPFNVSLSSGSSTKVRVFESNFKGTFKATVAPLATPGAPQSCPISVTAAGDGAFSIKATAAIPSGCSVQFTDSDNFATAQVYVNS